MRLIHMKCPDCGSVLDVDPNGKPVLFCQFCGARLLIDDESKNIHFDDPEKAGYEFEQGRIKAQKEEERKQREKEEQIAEAKRIMDENYKKHYAMAEEERRTRNAKYILHGLLLFLVVTLAIYIFTSWFSYLKFFASLMSGIVICSVQAARCKQEYRHSYQEHVETDDEGNIIHANRM